jgi:hypothetical protein
MTVGGFDLIYHIEPALDAPRIALDRVRDIWPEARLMGFDEDDGWHGINDLWTIETGLRLRRRIVHRDPESVESWDRDGMTPENQGSMILLCFGEPSAVREGSREVTLACGERNEEMERLARELAADFAAEPDPNWAAEPAGARSARATRPGRRKGRHESAYDRDAG